ncbi:hypothetical protein P691DRAFT_808549 [Macrolepiota fuliginosa MF-IS2]|uniref:Thioredoxin domain-containing protein n=1 Tax=Macrolepiota fuliginosa MF-IS2 TaxID=1400762 RepID=A0A9P5XMW2_9AGAR|nr:hypothetical protein P691DRAFT_808549 [Macrolepiota fuliginosa MF-IS2]
MLPQLVLGVVLTSSWVLADGLFAEDSLVKTLDSESFKRVLEFNQTTMIAFVSPSNLDCQQMVPDYEKAALGLHPLVPTYAMDCKNDLNTGFCREQGIDKFPTIKLFPRGRTEPSLTFANPDERSASAYYYWAIRGAPNYVTKHYRVEQIQPWVEKTEDKNAVLLLTKDKKIPLLWKSLANKYAGQVEFASHRDRKGRSSVELGMEAGGQKEAKILVYPAGSTTPFRYEGINKIDSLSKFLDSVLDGTVNLKAANEEARAEEFVPDEKELEIERKQEAQRLALAHGGFTELIDFEKAIKEGHGADYHDVHGYPGMMGGPPPVKKADRVESDDSQRKGQDADASSRIPDEL